MHRRGEQVSGYRVTATDSAGRRAPGEQMTALLVDRSAGAASPARERAAVERTRAAAAMWEAGCRSLVPRLHAQPYRPRADVPVDHVWGMRLDRRRRW
jgi:hypothetical protein